MVEALLALLLRQTLVLALAWPLLLALRPLLLRWGGPGLSYAAWVLLPALLLVASLPGSAAAQQLAGLVWAAIEAPQPRADLSLLTALRPPSGGSIGPWLLALWAGGVGLGLLLLAGLQRRFVGRLRPAGGAAHWWAPAGAGPALVGWPWPRLVLPLDFEQRFSAEQQVLVRCHEGIHRQRHDNGWNLLATLICLLHWFNPAAWWLLRQMRRDQELACDAAVIARHPASQAAYGHALLQARSQALPAALPWSTWPGPHPLTERIAMLKRPAATPSRRRAAGLFLLLTGLAAAGAVHAWRAGENPAAPAAGEPAAEQVEVDMALDLQVVTAGRTQRQQGRPRMRLAPGAQGMLILNGSPQQPKAEQFVIKLRALPAGDGHWQLDLELAEGLPLQTLARPRLIVREGESGRVELGEPSGRQLSLLLTPRRAAAGTTPAQDASR